MQRTLIAVSLCFATSLLSCVALDEGQPTAYESDEEFEDLLPSQNKQDPSSATCYPRYETGEWRPNCSTVCYARFIDVDCTHYWYQCHKVSCP